MSNPPQSTFNLRSILERERLNSSNFRDWERNLRILLMQEKKEFVIDEPIPDPQGGVSNVKYRRHVDADNDVRCLMLAAMSPDLQKQFLTSNAYSIITELKSMFQEQAKIERYRTQQQVLNTRLERGKPVSPHVLRMMGLFDNMRRLGNPYDEVNAVDIILNSLHKGFEQFVLNYNMNSLEKSLNELHGMLKVAEQTMKDEGKTDMLMINKSKGGKGKGKGKGKRKRLANVPAKAAPARKQKVQLPAPADVVCFYGNGVGHYKRDCPKFLEDKKNGCVAISSGPKKKHGASKK